MQLQMATTKVFMRRFSDTISQFLDNEILQKWCVLIEHY